MISEYEYQKYKYNKIMKIQQVVRNLLEYIYDDINSGARISDMIIYVNEQVYQYIHDSNLIKFVDVRIDPDRDLSSFGYIKISELKPDVDDFFEYN
jgi:hypothetical protein